MENMMEEKFRPAYYVGTHPDSFRSGEAAIIKAVETYKNDVGKNVVCFLIEYGDGTTDFCPLWDFENYKLLLDSEVKFCYKPV
jgi:hypothetical protein